MGQGIGRVPEAPAIGGDLGGAREPIGRYIAQQRRLRGIELEDLAARTRIPRRSLERLEAGAFDRSPDGFSRGFVRTVAEAIGLDADDAVARMLPEPDAVRRSSPRGSRVLGTFAAAIALLGLAFAARELASSLPARTQRAARGDLPVRRDYVRALAEARGIETEKLGARAAVLAPLPKPEPPPALAESEPPAAAAAVAAKPPPPQPAEPPVAKPPPPEAPSAPPALVGAEPEEVGEGDAPPAIGGSEVVPAPSPASAADATAEPEDDAAEPSSEAPPASAAAPLPTRDAAPDAEAHD